MKKKVEIGVLAVLAIVLGYYAYQRIGLRLGGTPTSIRSEFASEEHWMVETIVRDLAEAAAHARGGSPDEVRVDVEIQPAEPLALPSATVTVVGAGGGEVTRTLTLERSFWTPENYVGLASELIGPGEGSSNVEDPVALESLLEPSLAVLVEENERISGRLGDDLRDPLAHEQAALLLAVFTLREAAYGFDDRRSQLLRMTSHLALARALRSGGASSPTGRVAEAAALAHAGRQVELFERLNDLPAPWDDVLYLFSTEDWRREVESNELLVQLMRFRARALTLGVTAALELSGDAPPGEDVEWGRIVSSLGGGHLASGGFVHEQIGRELAEAREVAQIYLGEALPPDVLSERLNEHPGRLVGSDGPRVLDWGQWAAFFQRHLMGAIVTRERMLRQTYGVSDEAMAFAREMDSLASGLEMNPIVQVRLSRYVGGRVEDTVGMDGSIAFTREHPELVNPTNWHLLEDTAAHMMRKRGMPESEAWLSPRVLVTSALESTRHRFMIFERTHGRAEALAALTEIAPHHPFTLDELGEQLQRRVDDESTYGELLSRLGGRAGFDLHALRELRDLAVRDEDRVDAFERMCALDEDECPALGWELDAIGRTDEAVATFEHFLEHTSSGIDVCNNASWLVSHYFSEGRRDEALDLSERAVRVGCSWGLLTRAHALERVGRIAAAEEFYQRDANRYEYDGPVAPPLFGFYYRQARVVGDATYEERFQGVLAQIFPDGLEPLEDAPPATGPTDGVLIDGESERLERAGLRGGDVIVGLDGWRVRTLDQYDAVRSFRDRTANDRDLRVRVWRQTVYHDLEAEVRGRYFEVRMRTLGTRGPSYLWR